MKQNPGKRGRVLELLINSEKASTPPVFEENVKRFVIIQPPPNQLANIDFDVIGTSDY